MINTESPDSDLRKVIPRLGAFHTLMSFLGSIGHLMAGSGLKELLELIYAPNALEYMLSGKAVSRAVRGHLIIDAALDGLLGSFSSDYEYDYELRQTHAICLRYLVLTQESRSRRSFEYEVLQKTRSPH